VRYSQAADGSIGILCAILVELSVLAPGDAPCESGARVELLHRAEPAPELGPRGDDPLRAPVARAAQQRRGTRGALRLLSSATLRHYIDNLSLPPDL
jgi:hypothetical protein